MFGGGIIADGKEAMLLLGEDKPSLVIWSNHVGSSWVCKRIFPVLMGLIGNRLETIISKPFKEKFKSVSIRGNL